MFFAAGVLAIMAGLFYAAGHHELGPAGATMCRYGSTFCDSPLYLLVAGGLAAVWGALVNAPPHGRSEAMRPPAVFGARPDDAPC